MTTQRLLALLVGLAALVALNLGVTLWAQTQVRLFAGVPYRFPLAHGLTNTVLLNDGAGNLSWAGIAVPSAVIAYSTSGSCPAGWSEYTAARGRYLVGLVAGGTNEGAVGTALTNTENRAVGQHAHLVIGTHTHAQNAHGHTVSGSGTHGHSETGSETVSADAGGSTITTAGGVTTTGASTTGFIVGAATAVNQSATTGITVDNTGAVAGTNAPYIQLLACRKD
jgi:hypothetical protein